MSIPIVILLAVIQGMAELLPVSSSAHVIVVEKLLHIDPTTPQAVFTLVMLHTGTMFAVIYYFWPRWRRLLSRQEKGAQHMEPGAFIGMVIMATVITGLLGLVMEEVIKHALHRPVESLFKSLPIIGCGLLAAGLLIIVAGDREGDQPVDGKNAGIIGVIQALCLPFRGFSRSGATISTGMLLGIPKTLAEDFSFALAVAITPAVILWEGRRLLHHAHGALAGELIPALVGLCFSFVAGVAALHWLSAWLEKGRWPYFGYYCLVVALVVFGFYKAGL